MRARRSFRPCLRQAILEDRLVLSQAATTGAAPLNLIQPVHLRFGDDGSVLGQIRDQYVFQFESGYADLEKTLVAAVSAATASGSTSGIVGQAQAGLKALNADLTAMLSLSPLAANHLTGDVQQSIVGTSSASLQSQLAGLIPSSGTTITSADAQKIESEALALIRTSLNRNIGRLVFFFSDANPDRQAIRGAGRDAPPLSLIVNSYETQFKASFTRFGQDYTTAATTMLNAADAAAIAANRPAFDAQVRSLLDTMTAELTSMLSISPLGLEAVAPQVQQRLIGSSSSSLLSQLAAIPTPTDSTGSSAQAFKSQSTTLITQALTDVDSLLADLFGPGRSTLAGGGGSIGGSSLDSGFGGGYNGFGNVFGAG